MRSNDSICTGWRLQMRRYKLLLNFSDCSVRPHSANHPCLPSPDWPAEINKIPDSKYWPIRQRKERLIKGVGPTVINTVGPTVGANPAILTFWIFDLKTPFQNKLTIKLTRKSSMSLPGRRSWLKQSGLHFDILFKTFITSSRCNTM